MYVQRATLRDARELCQGDLLFDVPRPRTAVAAGISVREGQRVLEAKAAHLKARDKNLRVMSSVEFITALVVSNDCDNFGGDDLMLCPVRPFKFRRDGMTPPERWENISQAATGTASPKLFYLPLDPAGPLERSEAQLSLMFPLTQGYLMRCVAEAGTTLRCGLTQEAVRHLQWAIGTVFSRDPREDDEWPSLEDLELKAAYYEHRIANGLGPREVNEPALAHARRLIAERTPAQPETKQQDGADQGASEEAPGGGHAE